MNRTLKLAAVCMTLFFIPMLSTGCSQTGQTPAQQLQQEQQVHDGLAATLAVAEIALADAEAFNVLTPPEVATATAADKAANAALNAMQASITAGDTNGYSVALNAFQAALGSIQPIIATHSAEIHAAQLKLKH